MIYKVVFGFQGNGQGWSEVHAMRNSSEDPQVALAAAVAVAVKRVVFLGREFEINVVRVSKYSNDGGTTRERGVAPDDLGWTNPNQTAVQAAEPAVVALKVTGFSNIALAPVGFASNMNRTYCGAPADAAVDNGGVVDRGKAGLGAAFDQWAALLVANSFGWLASKTILDLEISTITQLGNGRVELVTLGNVVPPLALNGIYPCRIRSVNNGQSPMNGQWNIRVTAAGTVVTQEVIGLALAQEGGAIRFYNKIAPFIPYAGLRLAGKTAKHKRGRPFGSLPGRAKKRQKG